jgi:pimeloyl-ACP methyl ester carboxylesterase
MKITNLNRRVKRLLYLLTGFIIAILLVLLYTAYIYQPKAVTDFKSKYLKTIASRYLKTEKFNIHYIHAGSGDPVILIHGGGTWLYSFRDNIPYLSKNFSVYAVDMPGHGYTVPLIPNPSYDLDMYCDFLLEFMNQQKIDKASLVGNSWGGGWALYFTQKHPERVDKLVLIDSSGINAHDVLEWELFKLPVIGEAMSKFINNASVEVSLKKVFFNKEKVNQTMVNEISTPLTFQANRNAQYSAERNLKWQITAKNLGNVLNKTLIIWGKNDNYLNYKAAYLFKNKIKNSTLLLLNNCGHVAHEDQPLKVNKAIEDFLWDNN